MCTGPLDDLKNINTQMGPGKCLKCIELPNFRHFTVTRQSVTLSQLFAQPKLAERPLHAELRAGCLFVESSMLTAARRAIVLRSRASGSARYAHHSPNGTSFEPNVILDRMALNPTAKKQLTPRVTSTSTTKAAREHWKRNGDARPSSGLLNNFADIKHTTLSEQAAVKEASRCLKCADAPCQLSCPTQIDVKSFISAISNKNYYGAAKQCVAHSPSAPPCPSPDVAVMCVCV